MDFLWLTASSSLIGRRNDLAGRRWTLAASLGIGPLSVVDPDSVGMRIQEPGSSEAEAVLYRGALADAGGITTTGEQINEALDVTSSEKFGRLLDNLVPQAFGVA